MLVDYFGGRRKRDILEEGGGREKRKYRRKRQLNCSNIAIVVGFGITKDVIKHFKNDTMGLVIGSQICSTIENSIKNGQNSDAIVASTKLYKSLLNELEK